ncbi:MAG TPA: efflux transporter outer membrane subunit [Casimicrobiaceae bacterium]
MTGSIRNLVASLLTILLMAGCADMSGLSSTSAQGDANALPSTRSLAGTTLSPAAWPTSDWWTAFHDTQLDALMQEALTGSPTLKVAEARTRKALAFADSAKAALYPQIDANLAITEQRFPEHGLYPPPFAGTWNTFNVLQANLNWEIDFWGKNRSAYESALDLARVAEIDAYAARLALSVNIAQTYVQLQRAYLLLDVAQLTLKEREDTYALTRDRTVAGLDSRLELKQAETAIPATKELITRLEETIAINRNALAALLGQGPDRGLAITRPAAEAMRSLALPSNVPAELIGRRPNLVAQRWRIESSQQNIANAKAQFYPNINLAAFIGLQSLGSAGFLSTASRTMGIGPAITLPIFEGGRLRANLAETHADYDAAVEQYNQAMADALKDVVDQLTSWRSVEQQLVQQQAALDSAQEAYNLALMRYREGIGNYLQVLSVEAPLLDQQSLAAELRARQLDISVNLVRALGGGFDASSMPLASANPAAH